MQIKKCLIVIAALIFLCPACTVNRVARQTPEPSGTPDRELYGASLDITDWFDADDFSGIADAMKEYGEKSDDGYILFYQHRDYMFGGPGSLDYCLYENSEYEHVRLYYALGGIVYQKLEPDTEHSPVAGARKGRVYYLPAVYDRAASAAEPDLAEPAERATAHIQSRMVSIRQADVRFRENHVYEKYGISEGDQRQFLISRYAGTLLYESNISMVATIEDLMEGTVSTNHFILRDARFPGSGAANISNGRCDCVHRIE